MKVHKRTGIVAIQMIALLILILISLASCAAPPAPVVLTRIQVERVTLPAGLQTCMAAPQIGNFTLQSQVADYIVRLAEAGTDCRNTVSAIAQIETAAAAK